MKKKLLACIIAITCLMTTGMTTLAAGSDPSVKFTKDNELIYEGASEKVSGGETVMDLGGAFKDIAPGESRSLKINLVNDNSYTADFYMSTKTMDALEDSARRALGAGYEVKLVAGGSTVYDSKLGGYTDAAAMGSAEGLDDISAELENFMLVATLAKGETSAVLMTVYFDGEAMDNAKVSDYTLSDGEVKFDFRVGYETPTKKSVKKKVVTIKKEPVIVNIYDEVTPLVRVKTGDEARIGIALLAVLAGVLLILAGRKRKSANKAMSVLIPVTAALVLSGALGMSSKAAENDKEYTITYRPGNVGHFEAIYGEDDTTVAKGNLTKKEAALEVASLIYFADTDNTPEEARTGITGIEATENGAIKITLKKGSVVPMAPTYIVTDAGYSVAETTVWGPASTDTVSRNADYVVDYVKLVDGVEFVVRYEDTAGNSIAPDYIGYDNAGTVKAYTAPSRITLSAGAFYDLVAATSPAEQRITLDSDKTKNVITYVYSYVGSIPETEIDYEYVDGGIIYNRIPGTATTVVNPPITVVEPGGNQNPGNVQNPENPQQPGAENPGEENQGGEGSGDNGESSGEGVIIADDTIPLEDTNTDEEDAGDDVVIEDEESPLAGSISEVLPYVLAAAGLALVLIILILVGRMKKSDEPQEEAEDIQAE